MADTPLGEVIERLTKHVGFARGCLEDGIWGMCSGCRAVTELFGSLPAAEAILAALKAGKRVGLAFDEWEFLNRKGDGMPAEVESEFYESAATLRDMHRPTLALDREGAVEIAINYAERYDHAIEEATILRDGRCTGCMEPINPLHMKCACIRSELETVYFELQQAEAEATRLREALEEIRGQVNLHGPKHPRGFCIDCDIQRVAAAALEKGAQG